MTTLNYPPDDDLDPLDAEVHLNADPGDLVTHFGRGGGPAYPVSVALANGATLDAAGVSTLAYFAAAALTGLLAFDGGGRQYTPEEAAEKAFAYARAMLRESSK